MGVLVGLYHFITSKTVAGRQIYALGGNAKAAKLSGINTEKVFFWVYTNMGILSAIAGIVLSGILAATMSTADSQLLAASSSISHNLLGGFFRVNISEKAAMQAARISVLVISVIAAFIARDPNSSVFGIVSFAWAGFGAAFGPVVLTALFWRRSNKQGALAGMIVGGVMVFVWKYLIRPMGGIWGIYELLPAFLLALAAIIIVSLATQAPEQAVLEEYDAVTKELKNEK